MHTGTPITPQLVQLQPGAEFAGYRIDGVAGTGGMGIVYRATHLRLERQVALKVILALLADQSRFRERFEQEARSASAIDHPNVVPIYEAGESDGRLYIAMRYVDGTDLRAVIESEGALKPHRAVHVVGSVAAALDAAHARGLVHRDVKPANVLIAADEHVYLSDFGITKAMSAASGPTLTGELVGTADYLAPEQIRGEQADARSDVYALGCVLYHALTGHAPFREAGDYAKMTAHLEQPPPSVTAAVPDVPAGLDAVVRRAMAKAPRDRYASAGELAADAVAALEQAQGDTSALSPAPAAPAPAATPEGPPASRRRRAPVLVASAVAAVVVAALAGLALVGGDDKAGGKQAAPARAAKPVAAIRTGRGPEGVAVDGGTVWVGNSRDDTLVRVDAGKNKLLGTPVPVGDKPDGVVAAKGIAWVTNRNAGNVQRLRAQPDPIAEGTVPVGRGPEGISLGKQLVWVTNSLDGTVSRIDRASASAVGGPIGVGTRPTGVFVGKSSTWVTNNGDDTVTRIDTASAEISGAPIEVGREPRGIVEAGKYVYVANAGDGTVTRLDRSTGRAAGKAIKVGRNPRELAAGAGSIWVANNDDNSVTRIDQKTGRVIGGPIPVGRDPLGVAYGAGAVWVANHSDGTVTRIRP